MYVWPFLGVAVLWLGGILAAVAGGVMLGQRRRTAGTALLAGGLLITLAPFAYAGWVVSPLSNPTTIYVEGFAPPADQGLTVELRHSRDVETPTEYHFGNAGDPSHVVGVFQEQHPDGVVTLAEGVTPRDGQSIWHLSTDDVRYDLTYASDGNWFELATQVVTLHPTDGGEALRIPFPRSAFGAEEVTEGQKYVNGWTMDQWAAFYADISSASVAGDSVTVASAQGPTATITLDDGITTIAIND